MSISFVWIVVQKLSRKSVETLIEYGRAVKRGIEGDIPSPPGAGANTFFVAPNPVPANPTMAELGTAIDALAAAYIIPKGQLRTDTIRVARKVVEDKLTAVGTNYVQLVANLPANTASGAMVIHSANMDFRKPGGSSKVEGLTIKNDPKQKGNMLARDKRFAKGIVYAWFVKPKTAPNYPSSVRVGNAARYTYTGLTSTGTYLFKTERTALDGSITVSEEVEETVL